MAPWIPGGNKNKELSYMKKYKFIPVFAIIMLLIFAFVPSQGFATSATLISASGASGFPIYGRGQAGNIKIAKGSYELTDNNILGDVIQLCRVPAGATIVGGRLYAGDFDLGTETLEIDIGWAANGTESADSDGLLNSGVLTGDAVTGVKPEIGTSMPLGGVLITAGSQKFTNETIIQGTVVAAANVFNPDGATVSIIIFYTMD